MTFNDVFLARTSSLPVQVARYTVVGGLAFCLDFAILYVFTEFFGIYYLISAAVAFLFGVTLNYLLSVAWVFDQRRLNNRSQEYIFFACVGILGLLLNNLLIWGLTEFGGLHYMTSKAISGVSVYLFNFATRKALLFSNSFYSIGFRGDRNGPP
jgi:putative flippase GtrA